jgi:hypothetical protein
MSIGPLEIGLVVAVLSLPLVACILIGRSRVASWLGFVVTLAGSVALALSLSLVPKLNPTLPTFLPAQMERAMVIGAVNGSILGLLAALQCFVLRRRQAAENPPRPRIAYLGAGSLCLLPWIWHTCVLSFDSFPDAFAKLEVGMSRGKVESLLGPPTGRPSVEDGQRLFNNQVFWDVWGDGSDFGERDYISAYWNDHSRGVIRVDYKGDQLWRARWVTGRGEQGRLQ